MGKESTCNAGDTEDMGSIAGLGRFPEGGNGNPLQCSCLKNPMDRGAWRATVHGIAKSQSLSSHRGFHQAPPFRLEMKDIVLSTLPTQGSLDPGGSS